MSNTTRGVSLNEGQFHFEVIDGQVSGCSKHRVPWVRPFSQDDLAVALRLAVVEIARLKPESLRPKIVCLCGSTRFMEEFRRANLAETLDYNIVLSVGCDTKSIDFGPGIKARLDELHKRKIDLADEILVLNVGGYIGESTRSEIEYAKRLGKPIRYWGPDES